MTVEKIKKIREATGAGIADIKKALEKSGGDDKKALEILRSYGADKAQKKSSREASEGVIGFYVHSNNKIGALIELKCETDFVARNEDFKQLARDIAMHVAAMDPKYLKPEDVSDLEIKKEKEIWQDELKRGNKPENVIEKALAGKEKKYREENALLTQPFVKNPDITIADLINEKVAAIGENIQVGKFTRLQL